MDTAKTRNDARRIESSLLNKIALKGVTSIAAAVGLTLLKSHAGKSLLSLAWRCYWPFWSGVWKTKKWRSWLSAWLDICHQKKTPRKLQLSRRDSDVWR